MQVFQDEHQRSLGRQHFQRLAYLPHHAFPRGAQNLALQSLALLRLEKRRELHQPGRCVRGERLNHLFGPGATNQLAERVQERVVGLFSAESFHTLPTDDSHVRASTEPLFESIDQRTLADSSFARHEYDLALSS